MDLNWITTQVIKKTAEEVATSCVYCGGQDRLIIRPNEKQGKGTVFCRQCGFKGDLIDLYRAIYGCSFNEAREKLGGMTTGEKKTPSPARLELPNTTWLSKAKSLTEYAHSYLMGDADLLYELFNTRGLIPETVKKFKIGFMPKSYTTSGKDWGIDDGKVLVPRGWVIPTLSGEATVNIKIRRLAEDVAGGSPKYTAIKGGVHRPFYVSKVGYDKPLLVVEGEFDAFLAWQLLGDFCNILCLRTTSGQLPDDFNRYPFILLGFDNDEAGQEATKKFIVKHGQGREIDILPFTKGKDLTEHHLNGGLVREYFLVLFGGQFGALAYPYGEITADDENTIWRAMINGAILTDEIVEAMGGNSDKVRFTCWLMERQGKADFGAWKNIGF